MSKIKVLSVMGARPQFMKAAVLSKALSKDIRFDEVLVHTGQHYDANMSSSFINELFDKKIDYLLEAGGKNEIEMIAYILCEMQKIILEVMPKIIIVFGDTTTTLATALTARKMNIALVHVESGVRNYDNKMPEEINRVIVDRLSSLNVCVTATGKDNLYYEGFNSKSIKSKVVICGDLMYEAYLNKIKLLNDQESLIIKKNNLITNNYILCTIHRASNVDNLTKIKNIISAINKIHKITPIVFPIHPRTKAKIEKENLHLDCITCDPLSYSETLLLLRDSIFTITDSGGLVRESYFAKKKSIFILESPVWPEINNHKCSLNIRPVKKDIISSFYRIGELKSDFSKNIFGDGNTASRIIELLEETVNFDTNN